MFQSVLNLEFDTYRYRCGTFAAKAKSIKGLETAFNSKWEKNNAISKCHISLYKMLKWG